MKIITVVGVIFCLFSGFGYAVNLRLTPEEAIAIREEQREQRQLYEEQRDLQTKTQQERVIRAMEKAPWSGKKRVLATEVEASGRSSSVLRITFMVLLGLAVATAIYMHKHPTSRK